MDPIHYLFEKYYKSSSQSKVTSSHWANYGEAAQLTNDGRIIIGGKGGFGDFIPSTGMQTLLHSPDILLSRRYSKRHVNSDDIREAGIVVARKSGRIFSYDCARQLIAIEKTISVLQKEIEEARISRIAVIGDGYGFLGNTLKLLYPLQKIIFINLGKQLLFDVEITRRNFSESSMLLVKSKEDFETPADFYFLEAENFHWLEHQSIDLFFNIASMQEMDKVVVDEYFRLMRSSRSPRVRFFSCNRSEKRLPDGQVIRSREYHWRDAKVLLSEDDPEWYRFYPTRRPPFWRPFDGTFEVRLVEF